MVNVSHPDAVEFPRRRPGQSVSDYLMEVARFSAPEMKDGPTYEDVMDELYDPETGLPRGWEGYWEKPKP